MLVFGLIFIICVIIGIKMALSKDGCWTDILWMILVGFFAGAILSVLGGALFKHDPIETTEITPIIIDNEIYYKDFGAITKYSGRINLTNKDYIYISKETYDISIWFICDKQTLMIPEKAVK